MVINVKGYGPLRKYTVSLPSGGNIEMPEHTILKKVFEALNIPSDVEVVFFVNGRVAQGEQMLRDGDMIVIFSPMEGG